MPRLNCTTVVSCPGMQAYAGYCKYMRIRREREGLFQHAQENGGRPLFPQITVRRAVFLSCHKIAHRDSLRFKQTAILAATNVIIVFHGMYSREKAREKPTFRQQPARSRDSPGNRIQDSREGGKKKGCLHLGAKYRYAWRARAGGHGGNTRYAHAHQKRVERPLIMSLLACKLECRRRRISRGRLV